MLLRSSQFAILLVLADITLASVGNGTIEDVNNKLDAEAINKKLEVNVETRKYYQKKKKGKRDRSTSSSSGERKRSRSKASRESLSLSSESTSSDYSKNGNKPKSSAERRGWRKWHRKCQPCPEEMSLKWADRRIKWICGAYQRARRSFKSLCMMYYRNCQDGTMFTKIHDHRCADDDGKDKPHGDHFFYDYKVRLSDESSKSGETDTTSSLESEDISNY